MFLADDQSLHLAGGTAARPLAGRPGGSLSSHTAAASLRRLAAARPLPTRTDEWRDRLAAADWVPDLGTRIGSLVWWRGLATCTALTAVTVALAPGFRPIPAAVPAPIAGTDWDEARGQAIAPLAWGADTGRRMAANDLVRPLAEAPERPLIDLSATMGAGDRLTGVLQRAGVGRRDAEDAAALIAGSVDLADIPAGTRLSLTLGRRPNRMVARPLENLKLRARFDLAVTVARAGTTLAMTRQPIAIDRTPLRLQGLVGSSLYRSARAAGAPAKAVEGLIKALATRVSLGRDVGANDRFDLVMERERAATGEVRLGNLLYVGLDRANGGGKPLRLVRFGEEGRETWWDPAGQSERRGMMGMPVAGRITSSFGYRMHPLLGFLKLHRGLDIGAPHGAPIYAALDGVVQFAGRSGGYGNFVKLGHGAGIQSGYGHMSRIAVRSGQRIGRGQVIGYVGSTGMSTGPHLHWEVWKNGRAVNPRSISFDQVAQVSGDTLRKLKARMAELLSVRVGGPN